MLIDCCFTFEHFFKNLITDCGFGTNICTLIRILVCCVVIYLIYRPFAKRLKSEHQFLLSSLLGPAILGVIITIIVNVAKGEYTSIEDDLLITFISMVIFFLIDRASDFFQINLLKKWIVLADSVYKRFLNPHIKLSPTLNHFLSEKITEHPSIIGFNFFNVKDDAYANTLKIATKGALKSVYTTLTEPYYPSYFFNGNNSISLDYFKSLNELPIKKKKRILVFKKSEFIDDIKKFINHGQTPKAKAGRMENIKKFFTEYQSNFEIFFLNADKFKRFNDTIISRYGDVTKFDFAYIDNSLIIKHGTNDEMTIYNISNSDDVKNNFVTLFDNVLGEYQTSYSIKFFKNTEEMNYFKNIQDPDKFVSYFDGKLSQIFS